MSLGEFDIIGRYFKRPTQLSHNAHIGIGDDCAVFDIPEGQSLAVSLDTLVAGRHFPFDAKPADIATRAFCVCLSDLAAMGAQPLYYTLALTMPSADESWLQAFSDALHGIAKQYDCALIGGDTTQGPLTISLQVHGSVLPASVLRRDGAKIGDKVYVTDCLGDGAASLAMLQGKQVFTDPHKEYLKQRFYCPEPQINAGIALRGLAHAAVDISDGLLADCQHMASASDVDFIVDVEQIPLSAACQSVDIALARQWAFSGGDDYQLAFTIPEQNHKALARLLTSGKIKATCIGSVKARSGEKPAVTCHYQQQPWSPPWLTQGFDHFAT